jgi:hypothetical protein
VAPAITDAFVHREDSQDIASSSTERPWLSVVTGDISESHF